MVLCSSSSNGFFLCEVFFNSADKENCPLHRAPNLPFCIYFDYNIYHTKLQLFIYILCSLIRLHSYCVVSYFPLYLFLESSTQRRIRVVWIEERMNDQSVVNPNQRVLVT